MDVTSRARAAARLGLAALAVVAAASAEAAFLRNVPQTVVQPDGTVLHLLATGDEYYNRLHDAAGFTVVRDPANGLFEYAVEVDGRLQPSGLVVGVDDPAAAGLRPGAMPDPRTLPSPDELFPVRRRHAQVRTLAAGNAPAFAAVNNLVVFIRFADEPPPEFNSFASFQGMFDTRTDSMENYFLEASYGQLTVSSTFYPPPSGDTVTAVQDPHPRGYFKPYNATANPDGYHDSDRNAREWTMLQGAIEAVAAQVPPALDLDTNHDGYIDSVVFVVSGAAAQGDWSNLLWPHRWTIDDRHYPATVNGKQLGDYNLQLNNTNVGVLCHEMTHTLGAPDLYHYSDCPEPNSLVPVGRWDLMADDRDPPQHTTAYLKWRYLGFLATMPAVTRSGDYTLAPLSSPTGSCYRIASPNSTGEYFVVEYRKRVAPFDTSLPGSGLLVYRINTAADGAGDRCGPPDEVYVYRPGGTPSDDGDLNHANFSADPGVNRTAIDGSTDPSPFLTSGLPGGLAISNVGTAGDTISFHVEMQQPCVPGSFALASPANGANLDAAGTATLSWSAAPGATSYDLYFGTDAANPPLAGNQTATSAQVPVAAGGSYFWRVAARNACGQANAPTSGVWGFTVAASTPGITIFADDFESGLAKWSLGRTSGAAATGWGVVSCRTAAGNGAAWCAGGGTAPQPACTVYAPNQGTFLIAGPFSLADAADGTFDFDVWYDVDDGGGASDPPDVVYWMWSLDGRSYYGAGASGASAGWEHRSIRLAGVTMDDGTPIVGKPTVYFAFLFVSDGTTQREGAYVDNVVIKKIVGQPGPPAPRVRRHLPRP